MERIKRGVLILIALLTSGTVYQNPYYPYIGVINLILYGLIFLLIFDQLTTILYKQKILLRFVYSFILIIVLFKRFNTVQSSILYTLVLLSLFDIDLKKTYLLLYKALAFICFLSLISYFMALANMHLNYLIIEPVNPLKKAYKVMYYIHYVNSNIWINSKLLYRFQSFFNEPGNLGTLIGLLFLFDRDLTKLKKSRIILFISGILTLSTAFFTMICLKILLGKAKLKKIIYILIFFLITLIVREPIKQNLPFVYRNTYSKLDRVLEKDVRVGEDAKIIMKEHLKSSKVFLGTGKKFGEVYPKIDMSSWKNILYTQGIFGLIIYIVAILYMSKFKNRDTYTKLMVLVFIINIYQRPYILNYINTIILIAGSEYSNREMIVN